MSVFKLKDYQLEDAQKIIDAVKRMESLPAQDEKSITLDVPTGMGKTVVLAKALSDYICQQAQVIFLTPNHGGLDHQAQRVLKRLVPNADTQVISESNIRTLKKTPGLILVAGWSAIVTRDKKTGDYKNRVTRNNEQLNLFDFLSEDNGTPVVLVVDEAHYGKGKQAQAIVAFLADVHEALGYRPIVIEASATPIMPHANDNKHHEHIKRDIKDGRKEQLIRSSVVLNAGINDTIRHMTSAERASTHTQRLLLECAFDKQEELYKYYLNEGEDVLPLIGIQIPNGVAGNLAMEQAIECFAQKGITKENGGLAVYLADNKSENIQGIANHDSPVRVLIYKQAIATGWDCPRAQILVGFRAIKSEIFTVQSRGRFYRTTGGKYYRNSALNKMYIFSDEDNFPKAVATGGGSVSDWPMPRILLADETKLTELKDLNLWGARFKRTGQDRHDRTIVAQQMQLHFGRLTSKYAYFSSKDVVGQAFAEDEVSMDDSLEKGIQGKYAEDTERTTVANDYKHTAFDNEIKEYICNPIASDGIRLDSIDFVNNARVAETVRGVLNRLLRRDTGFMASYKKEHDKISFEQFVIQQFQTVVVDGVSRNPNSEALHRYISRVFTSEGAPQPLSFDEDGADGGTEGRTFSFVGSFAPDKNVEVLASENKAVNGLRAEKRLYHYEASENGENYSNNLSSPEEAFEEMLAQLKRRNTIADYWIEHNGVGNEALVIPINNGKYQLNHFPDYYGVITRRDGVKVPFISEVKGEKFDAQDAHEGNSLAKHAGLLQYGKHLGILACLVYKTDDEWVTPELPNTPKQKFVDMLMQFVPAPTIRPVIAWDSVQGYNEKTLPDGLKCEWMSQLGIIKR